MNGRARILVIATLAVAAAGCAAILGIDDGTPRDAAAPFDAGDAGLSDVAIDVSDAALDAGDGAPPMCDVDAAFGTPTAFTKLNTAAAEAHLRLTPTELAGVFQSNRDGGLGSTDIYSATRTTIGDTWTNVAPVGGVNSASGDNDPSISADQLTIYFARGGDILRATRASATSAFATPVALAEIDSTLNDFAPYIVEDGTALYFSSARNSDAGVSELFVTQPLADGGFTAVANVAGTNLKTGDNRFAAVTADQLVMYFASTRGGGAGGYDVWVSTRASTTAGFGAPRVVPEVNTTADEQPGWVSSDRCRLYFSRSGGTNSDDLYVATKTP